MSNIVFWTATQMAKAIRDSPRERLRQRQVSSEEVLEAHLKQIEMHNAKLNAIVTLDRERARQQAKAADEAIAKGELWGALHGVPITAKDCYETAGMRSSCGYKKFFDYIPAQDATIIARMKAAGAIVLGKTNMAILASDMQTVSDFGRTNNPWDLARTTGGSSGGSAAAVAAGFVPMDLCTGLGGSARIPAHWEGFAYNIEQFLNASNSVIVIGSYTGINRIFGKSMSAAAAHIYDLRDGKVCRFRMFADTKTIWDTMSQ